MKKIGIDARLYNKTGVGVYIRNLLFYLQRLESKDISFYVYLLPEDYKRVQFSSDKFIKRQAPYQWHSFSEQIGFLQLLYRDNLDLMHFTYFSYPILYKRKFVATIHDTILLEHKTGKASTKNSFIYELKHFVFRYVLVSQLNNSEAVITPSNTVKNQLVELFGEEYEKKITPIYEGIDHQILSAKENPELSKQFSGDFFMYVGNFYPHKNIETLVEAFAKASVEAKLILIGPNDFFSKRISDKIASLGLTSKIVIYNNASVEDLVYFYNHAKALIHPSHAEGFGLPLIEAAYFNLPILASDIEVYKELMGDKFISINPNDSTDIANKIVAFMQHPHPVNYLDTIKKYSFERMAQQTLEVYISR